MQIIIICEEIEDPIVIEVPFDGDTDVLIQLVMAESGKSIQQYFLEFEGRMLQPGLTLAQIGIVDGSAVVLKRYPSKPAATPAATPAPNRVSIYDIPADIKPEALLALVTSNPQLLAQFQHSDPEMGQCLATNNLASLRSLMMKRYMSRHKQVYEQRRDLEKDPMDPEMQKKIEEAIRMENIQENMAAALENLPEAFGRVTMLYVNIEVNGHPVKAFVDSGAQSTIMSKACAERCNMTRLIDTRFAGEARGVGTAKIYGRVHIAQMKFGNSFFPINITILENDDVDFLFGLDTLRRYRCSIDLSKNVLKIEGVNGQEEVPFLPESDLPENARGHYEKQ